MKQKGILKLISALILIVFIAGCTTASPPNTRHLHGKNLHKIEAKSESN